MGKGPTLNKSQIAQICLTYALVSENKALLGLISIGLECNSTLCATLFQKLHI